MSYLLRGHTNRPVHYASLALIVAIVATLLPVSGAWRSPAGAQVAQEAPELATVTVSENRPVAPVELTDDNAPGRNAGGIAVNPEDPDHLVAFTWDAHAPAGLTCEFHVSRDGGATWSTTHFQAPEGFGTEPVGERGFCSQERGATRHSSRGEISFAEGDRVYTTFLSVRDGRQGTSVLVARSDDGGDSFGTPIEAIEGGVTGTETDGIVNPQHPSHNFPRLAVDPGAGVGGADRLYVSGTGSTVDPVTNTWSERNVSMTVSNDGGVTWSDAVAINRTNQTVDDNPLDFNANLQGDIVIDSNGTAYTTWLRAGTTVQVGKTSDGGQTWQVFDVVETPGDAYPRLAVDDNTDDLYLVYALEVPPPPAATSGLSRPQDHWFGQLDGVYLTKSTDAGQNWSQSVKVNDEPPAADGNEVHQMRHPNVAVSPSGRVDVVWFDRRHWIEGRTPLVERNGGTPRFEGSYLCTDSHWSCSEARTSDIYHAFSTDGGASFSADVRVTDYSSNNDQGWEFQQGSFWHHGMTLDHAGDDMVAAWADSRRGKALPGTFPFSFNPLPNAFRARENEDLFFAKVSYDNHPDEAPRVETLPADNAAELSVTMSEEVGYAGGVQGRGTNRAGAVMATSPFSQAVVVNEGDWASALVGSVLARRYMGPVLATPADALPASVSAEIDRMELFRRPEAPIPLPEGTDTSEMVDQALTGAFILGGTDDVSTGVQTNIEGRNIPVQRFDQGLVEMAAQVALHLDGRREFEVTEGRPAFDAVVIVNPNDPDSAGVSVLAASRRLPVLFVEANAIPPATQSALDTLDIDQTLVVGDTDAVSDTVLGALPGAQRLSGSDVYATSAAIVEESHDRGLPKNIVYVVGPDPMHAALAGSPVARAGGMLVQAPDADPQQAMATIAAAGLENYVNEIVRFGANTLAPVWPVGASVTTSDITQTSVTLTWPAPTDDIGVTGYHVYQNGVLVADLDGSPAPTTHTITGLQAGTTYTFTVEAHDNNGNESGDGPSVTVTTQAPDPDLVACPAGVVPPAPFTDIAGNTHEATIQCIVWYGLTRGTTDTTYSPAQSVTRDQMASFIARMMEAAGVEFGAATDQGFTDIAGNVHADRINQLASVGVVLGTTPTTYSPRQEVRRDQMASFLIRAYEVVNGQDLERQATTFTDIAGNVHQANIEKAATAGFALGTTASTYSPENSVRRDQMGSFLARVLQRGMTDGHVALPGGGA